MITRTIRCRVAVHRDLKNFRKDDHPWSDALKERYKDVDLWSCIWCCKQRLINRVTGEEVQ